jgi:hypothetical protein
MAKQSAEQRGNSVSDESLFEAWLKSGSETEALRSCGIQRGSKARKRLKCLINEYTANHQPEIPPIPDVERDADTLIEMAAAHRERLQASLRARHSSVIRIPSNKPFGVVMLPDQHMDNPGANVRLIFQHANLIRDTDGLYAVEVGDGIDNFIIAKLAEARREHVVSHKESWVLLEDYHRRIALKLLAAISGNHLNWTTKLGGVDHLQAILKRAGVKALYDADELYFNLQAANGRKWMWGMRHFFRGDSLYNSAHSVARYAMSHAYRGEDVIVAGHKHVAGYNCLSTRGKTVECIQVGSYKDRDFDDYCRTKGFMAQHPFLCPVIIHHPDDGRSEFYKEIEHAIPYLKYLRSKK